MTKEKSEEINSSGWLTDLPAPTAKESFEPEQLISCPRCGRKNAPSKTKCLYCGENLPLTEFSEAGQLSRKLESWEKGFNLILLPNEENLPTEHLREIAKTLRLEIEDAERIFKAGKPLPLACAESENEAKLLAKNLRERGFETTIVSDEQLSGAKFPQRLRGLEFSADEIVLNLFNADQSVRIARENLRLIVTGILFERRIESTQKHQRKKENKTLDTTEMSSDTLLIDLYDGQNFNGYRIESNGFDFSCLADEKQLLAAQNMKKLAEKLRVFAPDAKFDDDYRHFRAEIGCVWEAEETKDFKGMKKGFGKINFETVTNINNLKQFTRYSRLLRNLL